MRISEIKIKMKIYRDSFGSDLIFYDYSLKTKKELAEVIRTQINHNRDRQIEDESLRNFCKKTWIGFMKFTTEWKKLDYPIFTTIRQDKGYYKVGQNIPIETPSNIFVAEIVSIREMIQDDITDTMALRDADCTKEEFKALLYRFYKDNVGDLILLTLMKI